MFYQFPEIKNFSDLKPYILENSSITVSYKDDYIVVNYNVADKETFPDLSEGDIARYRREMRGIIFDLSGNVLRRPFQKFFNLGEREELLLGNIDFDEHHVILDKVDGSMVTPLMSLGQLRFATKAGITDMSPAIEAYVDQARAHYRSFCEYMIDINHTPIFEYVSRDNRIVLDYKEQNLILLGIRNNLTGNYISYKQQIIYAYPYYIPVVKEVYNSKNSIDDFVRYIYNEKDIEGVVVRFDNGHMLKIKTEWYVNIHRAKDACLHEKRVIEMILDSKTDDVLAFLPPDDAKKLSEYSNAFLSGLNERRKDVVDSIKRFKGSITRKEYALEVAPHFNSLLNAIIFKCWDNEMLVWKTIQEIVRRHLGSQTDVDKVRFLWGDATWKF